MKTKELTTDEVELMFEMVFKHKKPITVTGSFFKVNGEKRLFTGIMNHADENVKGTGISNRDTFLNTNTVSYFDTDKEEWRRFKLDRLDEIQFEDGDYIFKGAE